MKNLTLGLFLLVGNVLFSQNSVLNLKTFFNDNFRKDEIARAYVTPVKIVWQSDNGNNRIKDPEVLLTPFDGQLSTSNQGMCLLKSDDEKQASILLDFGRELYGGIEIASAIRADKNPVKVRIRFGESVSEAMSDCGTRSHGMSSATNDHSLRDFTLALPWLGTVEIGNSGFRFVRIDLLDKEVELPLRSLRAISRYRDIPYLGSFKSSDERLNKIWATGAYTVHVNMQDYLWDGIKRDRLVWVGDMHPEVMTINTVFGKNDVVKKSLDFAKNTTPLPGWMNGISSYSLWWIIIHRDLYLYQGDMSYLKQQHDYLKGLVAQIEKRIERGKENLDGMRFLDWPTSENKEVIHSGLQALTLLAMEAAEDIASWLNDAELGKSCGKTIEAMKRVVPSDCGNKQAAALLSLAGIVEAGKASSVILNEGAKDFATFYGYYMLEALAKAGKYGEALDIISDYWGAMLDLGATTFWENFIYSERENALPIDQLASGGRYDIHADAGNYCYIGLRASLCHGWASGPTSWLTAHVLGIQVVEPACKTVRIRPNLGGLEYAEGSFPTPYGPIYVKHIKQADGKIKSDIEAPEEIRIVR